MLLQAQIAAQSRYRNTRTAFAHSYLHLTTLFAVLVLGVILSNRDHSNKEGKVRRSDIPLFETILERFIED